MPRLRGVIGVAALASKWILRQPSWLLQDVLMIVAFFIIIAVWGGRAAVVNMVAAWIIVGSWNLGVNLVGQEVGWSRIGHYYYVYVASPLTPLEYLLGVVLGNLPMVAIDASMLTIMSILVLGDARPIVCGLVGGLLLLPVAVFTGLALVLRVRKPTNISAITNPVAFVTTLLPPVFYPLTIVPGVIRPVLLCIPTVAAAELARSLLGVRGLAAYPAWIPLAVLVSWLALMSAMARRVIRWGLE